MSGGKTVVLGATAVVVGMALAGPPVGVSQADAGGSGIDSSTSAAGGGRGTKGGSSADSARSDGTRRGQAGSVGRARGAGRAGSAAAKAPAIFEAPAVVEAGPKSVFGEPAPVGDIAPAVAVDRAVTPAEEAVAESRQEGDGTAAAGGWDGPVTAADPALTAADEDPARSRPVAALLDTPEQAGPAIAVRDDAGLPPGRAVRKDAAVRVAFADGSAWRNTPVPVMYATAPAAGTAAATASQGRTGAAAGVKFNLVTMVSTAAARLFDSVSNWLVDLPATNLTVWAAGALTLIRKNLFDQASDGTPVADITTTSQSLAAGSLGAKILAAQRYTLNALANFLHDLPVSAFTAGLEAALLWVRRQFLNTAPLVSPSSQRTDEDGQISGRIGAVDFEADELSYTVTADPESGILTVDETGFYSFTPAPGFTGQDRFTVKVAPVNRQINLMIPGYDGSREVTIQIGGQGGQTVYDTPDTAVNLPETAGRLTVTRGLFGRYTGTVTLSNVADDTQGVFLDTTGTVGDITARELLDLYPSMTARANVNGTTIDLLLAYNDADDTRKAVVLNDVQMQRNDAGQYQLTGRLAPSPEIRAADVDVWDVTGAGFKPLYDTFRAEYNLVPGQYRRFKPIEVNFVGGDLYLDTVTPLSYERGGLYALDSESRTSAQTALPAPATSDPAAPATTGDLNSSATTAAPGLSAVTTSLALGQAVYIGRTDGTVEVWNAGSSEKQVIAGLTDAGEPPWGKNSDNRPVAVTSLTRYDRVLKDSTGQTIPSTFTGYIRGDELTVTGLGAGSTVVVGSQITAPGVAKGTIITEFIPKTGAGKGGVAGLTGTYRVSIAQTVGDSAVSKDTGRTAGVEFTQATLAGEVIPEVAPAVIVGLSNGSIQMYSPSVSAAGVGTGGWTELHGFEPGWGGVTAVLPYGEGFVVGLDNGYVRQWIGPTTNERTDSDANDPSTWKRNWANRYVPGGTLPPMYDGSNSAPIVSLTAGVTAMMAFRDRPEICPGDSGKGACGGFLVGRADGAIIQYNEGANGAGKPGWRTLVGPRNTPVVGFAEFGKLVAGSDYLPSFAFALRNGDVGAWTWDTAKQKYVVSMTGLVRPPGGDSGGREITSMVQLDRGLSGKGFAVGLSDTSVNVVTPDLPLFELRGPGAAGSVTTVVPFRSDEITGGRQGLIIGFSNGSVQAWNGNGAALLIDPGRGRYADPRDFVLLQNSTLQNPVTAMAPAVAAAINLNGDAVTRDGLVVGLADGSVRRWSGLVTADKLDGYITSGAAPAVFTGNVSGWTAPNRQSQFRNYLYGGALTVTQVESGFIERGGRTSVIGGSLFDLGQSSYERLNTLPDVGIRFCGKGEACTGEGGVGTYALTDPAVPPLFVGRDWVEGPEDRFVSGVKGRTLVLNLPASYLSNSGGLDPASLVGAEVTGPYVPNGTKITKFVGTANLPYGQAAYELNNDTLSSGSYTISGLPKDGTRDWTTLEGSTPGEKTGLGPSPKLSDVTCDGSWRCVQIGTLQQAVDFGKTLAAKGILGWSGPTSQFGTKDGVGSSEDPIFSEKSLYGPRSTNGTTYTFAFRKSISPDSLNYNVVGYSVSFKGTTKQSTNCGAGGTTQCTILKIDKVTTDGKTVDDLKPGMALEPGLVQGWAGFKATELGNRVANTTDEFYVDTASVPGAESGGLNATWTPLRVGLDVNPLAYGYAVVPDGFYSKMKPGQWSLGVLLAAEIGPSLKVSAQVDAPTKDYSLKSIEIPGFTGFDTFALSAGAKIGADVKADGLGDENTAYAYAYAVPGMLFTYNTAGGDPGEVYVDTNYYLDASATDFKSLTGATATAFLTPYVKLLYGIMMPSRIPLIGGWSVVSLGGGFETPITASLCVNRTSSCPTPSNAEPEAGKGSYASFSLNSSAALNYKAGLLGGLTSKYTSDGSVPLFQIADYTKVIA